MTGYEYNPLMPLNLQKRAKEVDPSQFATAEQGALADSALQNVLKSNTTDTYIELTISNKVSNTQEISVTGKYNDNIKASSPTDNGITTARAVQQYVRALFSSASFTPYLTTDADGYVVVSNSLVRYDTCIYNINVRDYDTNDNYMGVFQFIRTSPFTYRFFITDFDGNPIRNTKVVINFFAILVLNS